MERIKSIELAMKNEKTEMEFYRNHAGRTRNELAKKMFEQLAEEEREHMELIGKLHGRLVEQGDWPEDVPIEVAGTNVRRILESLASGKIDANVDGDDEQALERAIEFEKKGSEFYARLARECDNEMEKNFFEFLSKIEDQHRRSLADSLAYFRDPEGWTMQQEKSGLDGA